LPPDARRDEVEERLPLVLAAGPVPSDLDADVLVLADFAADVMDVAGFGALAFAVGLVVVPLGVVALVVVALGVVEAFVVAPFVGCDFVVDAVVDRAAPRFDLLALDRPLDPFRPPIGSASPTAFAAPVANSPTPPAILPASPAILPAVRPTCFTTLPGSGMSQSSCVAQHADAVPLPCAPAMDCQAPLGFSPALIADLSRISV
jgi:hypothetical protein